MSQDSRSGALRRSREQKMKQWFGARHWRVATEVSSETDDVVIAAGEFWTKGGKVFQTPLGHKGRHGYIMQEVRDGVDVPGSRVTFGWVTLAKAAEMFPGSIVELPPRPYGRRSNGPPRQEG